MDKYILLGKSFEELKTWTLAQGLPSYTASQLFEWIYRKPAKSFDEMTNISLQNRALLKEKSELGIYPPIQKSTSKDGTIKYLFPSREGYGVEAVYIPESDRATLCVSSQAGCKMNCVFV